MNSDAKTVVEVVGGETYSYVPLGQYVVRAFGVCGGHPTFKYTRIEITGTKDDALPALLREQNQPTFVTINETDFWQRIPASESYCCVASSNANSLACDRVNARPSAHTRAKFSAPNRTRSASRRDSNGARSTGASGMPIVSR